MTSELLSLKPAAVWQYFYQLTQVPRPSKHEDKIQAFMVEFGQSLGLETIHDDIGNVIIKKPASKGYEDRLGVILQAHLDMVPQANNDTPHDFVNDPITAYIDGEWVTAKGTTLGADNGIGVAATMAVLADKDIKHGPVEALFTCDEETGMTGAFGLKDDVLDGDILLNLDSEEEKELCIGCAGGIDGEFHLPITRHDKPSEKPLYELTIKGLKGGHSGVDIHLQRGNANKLLGRWLTLIDTDFDLINFNGGNLSNALPREATAVIGAADTDKASVEKATDTFKKILTREYGDLEPDVELLIEPAGIVENTHALTDNSKKALLNAITACHHGVYRMSVDIEGLVETSNNLAIIKTTDEDVQFDCMLRSSVDSARDELVAHLTASFEMAGATAEFSGAYPGWQPNPKSAILEVMKSTAEQLFGITPPIQAIHAGLECGLLGGVYPHWDMISFGPTICFPHSPDEKVKIDTVAPFYEWLLLTLENIPVHS
ncbi:MAG: aminoacyl-histidine dipeptidase [Gammaproteobacteria bacterium]|nr:aminoacyl-histidine dipeptidase [Gammaproteobacteria bacterium]